MLKKKECAIIYWKYLKILLYSIKVSVKISDGHIKMYNIFKSTINKSAIQLTLEQHGG